MKGVKRYDENYNPSHYAPAGVYSADNFRENLAELLRVREMTQEEAARLRRVGDRAQLAAGKT